MSNLPTEPGIYWAKVTLPGPGKNKPIDSYNAIVEISGITPFLAIDAHFVAEPRFALMKKNISADRVALGSEINIPKEL
jgi:hypothetical protein